MDDLAWT